MRSEPRGAARCRRSARGGALRLLVLGFLVEGCGPSAWAAPEPDRPQAGTPLAGSLAVTEATAQIMARQAAAAQAPPVEPAIFFLGRADTRGKKLDPAGEGLVQGPASGSRLPKVVGGRGPLAPQAIGVNADGPNSTVNLCGTPPDTMGAVGPTQFVVTVNCNIVSYNKTTGAADGVLSTTPNVFFSSVRSSSVSDPHVRYDRLSRRWFIVIIDVTFPNNRVLVAVSNTATITPSTTWTFFFFPSANGTHTNCLADYPTPGIDANALYIGVNQFCGASLGAASYAGSDAYVVQKSSVLGAGPIHATAFQSLADGYTPQGVDNPDPAASEGYFLAGSVGFWNKINLFRVANPASLSPTVTAVPITTASQGQPLTQPHLGNTGGANGQLDASDNRPLAATFRDGRLWTAMGVGVTVSGSVCTGVAGGSATRDAVFWWELQGIPTGSTPSIRQAGIVCDTAATNPLFFSYGTVMVNGQGHAAVGYTIAGATSFASAGTSGRLAGDALDTLQAINTYGPGTAAYNPSFDSGAAGFRRWGDFSYTSLDPCDDMTLWTIQEYTPLANNYGERFAQLKAPPPATPASASPSSVAAGQTSVSVVITGTSSSGSGFYDTPSSLSAETCRLRIAAAVAGGVTVNSVTYTDPTHVTLDLNTTAASAGLKTVTITNPDGQTAAAAVLTIGATAPPAPTATNNGPICAGQTLQLNASAIASATYAWTGPNSFSSALQNPTIVGATAAATGTYSVTATVGGSTSAPGTTVATVDAIPGTPVIAVAPLVGAGSPNRTASVALHAGATYAWTIGNGTITSGQGTDQITFTAGAAGTPLTLSVTESSPAGCTGAAGTATVTVAAAGQYIQYYTVVPCRQLDTRSGSALPPGGTLTVALTGGTCGIPATANAVSANVTVTQPTAPGYLTLYPTTSSAPVVSNINFTPGVTRANNAILVLANDGSGEIDVLNGSAGTVHVIIDVNGYLE
jgi:hypothetical protein